MVSFLKLLLNTKNCHYRQYIVILLTPNQQQISLTTNWTSLDGSSLNKREMKNGYQLLESEFLRTCRHVWKETSGKWYDFWESSLQPNLSFCLFFCRCCMSENKYPGNKSPGPETEPSAVVVIVVRHEVKMGSFAVFVLTRRWRNTGLLFPHCCVLFFYDESFCTAYSAPLTRLKNI